MADDAKSDGKAPDPGRIVNNAQTTKDENVSNATAQPTKSSEASIDELTSRMNNVGASAEDPSVTITAAASTSGIHVLQTTKDENFNTTITDPNNSVDTSIDKLTLRMNSVQTSTENSSVTVTETASTSGIHEAQGTQNLNISNTTTDSNNASEAPINELTTQMNSVQASAQDSKVTATTANSPGIHVFSPRVACLQGGKKLPRSSFINATHSDSDLGESPSEMGSLTPYMPKVEVKAGHTFTEPGKNPPAPPVHRPYIGSSTSYSLLHSESSGMIDQANLSPSDHARQRPLYRAGGSNETKKEVPPSTPEYIQRRKPHPSSGGSLPNYFLPDSASPERLRYKINLFTPLPRPSTIHCQDITPSPYVTTPYPNAEVANPAYYNSVSSEETTSRTYFSPTAPLHARQTPQSPSLNRDRPRGPRNCPPSTPTRNIPRQHHTSPFAHARFNSANLAYAYSIAQAEEKGLQYRKPKGPREMLGKVSDTSRAEMRTLSSIEVINGIAEGVRLSSPSQPPVISNTPIHTPIQTVLQSSNNPQNTMNYVPHRISPIAEATSEEEAIATEEVFALARIRQEWAAGELGWPRMAFMSHYYGVPRDNGVGGTRVGHVYPSTGEGREIWRRIMRSIEARKRVEGEAEGKGKSEGEKVEENKSEKMKNGGEDGSKVEEKSDVAFVKVFGM